MITNAVMTNAHRQKGQTIALVAVSMVSLVAMAALAIDLNALYGARGEIQRAADAAALAGAKAFVDTGVTTYPNNSTLQNLAQSMAPTYAAGAVAQNPVLGGNAQFASAPAIDLSSLPGNPRITVTLERTDLPLFFARIWGGLFATVRATAVAEAYNPSYSQSNTSGFIPSAPKCVKPFLIPNDVPGNSGIHFVNTGSGRVQATGVVGQSVSLSPACISGQQGCVLPAASNGASLALSPGEYLPLNVGSSHQYCPSSSSTGCTGSGTGDFEQTIYCCDGSAFDYQQCGANVTKANWDFTINPGGSGGGNSPVQSGLQCLIHTTTGNPQQDTLDPSTFSSGKGPLLISPGAFSQSRYGLSSSALVGTSDSIITVPLFDNSGLTLPPDRQVIIVGFLQLFVTDVNSSGNITATVLNVTGCGKGGGTAAPISGGGTSAIPVRLVHN